MSESGKSDEHWMRLALNLAKEAGEDGEVPVGAVIVRDGVCIGQGRNQPIAACDPSAHAEISALRDACQQEGNYRLPGATLYVTIEPCTMCVGALVHARIDRIVFGAREPKAGAVVSQNDLLNHSSMNTTISYAEGVLEGESSALMTDFFSQRRERKKKLKKQLAQSSTTDALKAQQASKEQ